MSERPIYPDNPTQGQEFTVGQTIKVWDGEKWVNKSFGNHEKRLRQLEETNKLTTVELINSSLEYLYEGDTIQTNGFLTAGDGGGALWVKTASTNTPSQTPAQLGDAKFTDSTGAVWELDFDEYINVRVIGVPYIENDGFNTAGNYSAHIQLAYDALKNKGGGELDLSVGKIPFSDTLYFGEGNGVLVKGYGLGTIQNSKSGLRASARTRLYYTGSGSNGVILTSDRNNTGAAIKRGGGGVVDVMLDGGETSAKGLKILSHSNHTLRVFLCYWAGGMFESNVLSNGVVGSPADTQVFTWDIQTADVNTSNEGEYHILLHGEDVANTSLGTIERMSINCESEAVAAHFADCDGLVFNFVQSGVRVGGGVNPDAGKIILHADDTLPASVGVNTGYCRSNVMVRAQLTKGVTAKATVSGVESSQRNYIVGLSAGNGSPLPVVESGATLNYTRDTGASYIKGHVRTVIGSSEQNVISAHDRVTTESARVSNGSSNHIVLENTSGDKTAGISLSNSTGNLRLSSGADIEINSKLILASQDLTLSAPAAATHKLEIQINGVTYHVPLTAV